MKLNWVEQMDEVLEIALVSRPLKLAAETPGSLVSSAPPPIPPQEPSANIAHQ
jgi:ATP-dependent Lon protease